jgi:hypothetical protein
LNPANGDGNCKRLLVLVDGWMKIILHTVVCSLSIVTIICNKTNKSITILSLSVTHTHTHTTLYKTEIRNNRQNDFKPCSTVGEYSFITEPPLKRSAQKELKFDRSAIAIVCIATYYALDSSCFESQWAQCILSSPYPSRPEFGRYLLPVKRIPGLLIGIKRLGRGVDPVPGLRMGTALCHLVFWRETLLLWYVVIFNIIIPHLNKPDLALATSLFNW